MKLRPLLLTAPLLALVGCKDTKPAPANKAPASASAPKAPAPKPLSRAEFSRLAAELALPTFWAADGNKNGKPDPAELVGLWGMPAAKGDAAAYIKQVFDYRKSGLKLEGLSADEKKRLLALQKEVQQGRPSLVLSDLSKISAKELVFVKEILAAAAIVERLFARQNGVEKYRGQVAKGHPLGRFVYYRNQEPTCVAPKTEKDAACHALPKKPPKVSGLYPAELQKDKGFCKALAKHKQSKELLHQFNVVVGEKGKWKAKPYSEYFADDMKLVAGHLEKAAESLKDVKAEKPLHTYLVAAAKAFRDNSWPKADEAWAKMNAVNSRWYLRIGPDETYFEPCNRKAGFHVSFARINQDSLVWQKKLDPHKKAMEEALAKLAGPPYKARKVSFHLPDFIDIVINAGDARSAFGATIGQSLPNWGPVANEGRGRTVAMTNLYTDADSKRELTKQASSLLCSATMKTFTAEPTPQVMSTVLHEAAHNLGPAHEYKVKGKKAPEIFGGGLASMLEELKAQTSALYFTDWLVEKKVITEEEAKAAHTRDMVWAFGHISRGMYTATKHPRAYSQLAAIQFGFLEAKGASQWKPKEKAANGKDVGCVEILHAKLKKPILELETMVLKIKGGGDKAGAEKLKADYVDVSGERKARHKIIQERWLRAPKTSFVYSVKMK